MLSEHYIALFSDGPEFSLWNVREYYPGRLPYSAASGRDLLVLYFSCS